MSRFEVEAAEHEDVLAASVGQARADEVEHHKVLLPWVPYKVTYRTKSVPCPKSYCGSHTYRYERPTVEEWINPYTGEWVSAKSADAPKTLRSGEWLLQKGLTLEQFRPEARPFIHFILYFRNDLGGHTPDMPTLVRWYCGLEGRRPSDVRRNLNAIEQAIVVEGVMYPAFQVVDKCLTRRQRMGEPVIAAAKMHILLCHAGKAGKPGKGLPVPSKWEGDQIARLRLKMSGPATAPTDCRREQLVAANDEDLMAA